MARARRGRHEGNVYQREDGRWEGRLSLGFDKEGRRIRRSVYGETKQDALAKMRELRTQPLPTSARTERVTFSEVWPTWIASLRAAGC